MPELLPFEVAIGRNANFQILGKKRGKCDHRDPQKALPCAKMRRLIIDRENRSTVATYRRGEETKKGKKRKSQTVIFHACAETPTQPDRSHIWKLR